MSRARLASTSSRAARSLSSRLPISSCRSAAAAAARCGSVAGVGGFVGERRVTDAVAIAFERGERGRGDRAGGIAGNAGGVDRDHERRGTEKASRASCRRRRPASRSASTRRRSAKLLPEPEGPTIPARKGVCASATTQSSASGSNGLARIAEDPRNRWRRRREPDRAGGAEGVGATPARASVRRLGASPRTRPIRSSTLASIKGASFGCRGARGVATIWARRTPASSANPLSRRRSAAAELQGPALRGEARRRACAAPTCFGNFSAMP